MAYTKRIVCLANSFKDGGCCIAGREVLAAGYGGWIRPISARETGEVGFGECRYTNYGEPKLLDVVEVPLLRPSPKQHQTENHIADTSRRWRKAGRTRWDSLGQLCEYPETLWINSGSTGSGLFNCMSPAEAAGQQCSLLLIRPEDFAIQVGSRMRNGIAERIYRGNFGYNGIRYSMSITDPVLLKGFILKQEGEYPYKDVYLCLSLTQPYRDGRCHKLVAAVIRNPEK